MKIADKEEGLDLCRRPWKRDAGFVRWGSNRLHAAALCSLATMIGLSVGVGQIVTPDPLGGFATYPLGSAQLTPTSEGTLQVSGVGSLAQDGFMVELGDHARSGFELELKPFAPDRIIFEAEGRLGSDSAPVTLGKLDIWHAGDEFWVYPDLSALGAKTLSVVIMDGGQVLAHYPASALTPVRIFPDYGDPQPKLAACSFVPVLTAGAPGFALRISERVLINSQGVELRGDEVRILALDATAEIEGLQRLRVTGAELPQPPGISWTTEIVGMSEWLQPLRSFTMERNTPAPGDVRISFPTDPDQTYRVLRSVDAVTWLPMRSGLAGTGGELSVADRGVMVHRTMLYRVETTRE